MQQLVSGTIFSWKTYILRQGLKVNSMCDTCTQSSKRDKNHDFFFKFLGVKKLNEPVVTGNKLKHNFAGLITSGLGPNVARRPPVGPHAGVDDDVPFSIFFTNRNRIGRYSQQSGVNSSYLQWS
jgi:hypothetical protein